ncbi:hypothetical protein QR680_013345 [Steinernema hermaphroditum]|uniref:EF-hand domain-containing protein n=1 Tax=Steinernema hermaphroditum TaxID=289476 RepID=A0AA39I7U1_9BILA|nr:hypothetical protein QR680_013345 [Steinernema hermaphroditum]
MPVQGTGVLRASSTPRGDRGDSIVSSSEMVPMLLAATLLLAASASALVPTNENVNSFDSVDLDGNQKITFNELEKWLKNSQHITSAQKIAGLFHSHDTNQDGQLDVAEFVPLAYALSKKPASQSGLIFKRIDINGDGVLTRDEAESSKEQIPVEILNGLFSVADINKDGQISFKELSAVLDNYEKPKSLDDLHLEAAQRLIDLIDQDGDHRVNPNELYDFSKQYSDVNQVEIAEAFTVLDTNADGLLVASELKNLPAKTAELMGVAAPPTV